MSPTPPHFNKWRRTPSACLASSARKGARPLKASPADRGTRNGVAGKKRALYPRPVTGAVNRMHQKRQPVKVLAVLSSNVFFKPGLFFVGLRLPMPPRLSHKQIIEGHEKVYLNTPWNQTPGRRRTGQV
jgi:hypothetical protein